MSTICSKYITKRLQGAKADLFENQNYQVLKEETERSNQVGEGNNGFQKEQGHSESFLYCKPIFLSNFFYTLLIVT